MAWIIVRNWQKYQHRDAVRGKEKGAPAWIKAYISLMHDDDFLQLTLTQRGLLISLWLEYAQSSGQIPVSTQRVSRRLHAQVQQKSLDALVHAGFIEVSASKPPAFGQQAAGIDKKRSTTYFSEEGAGARAQESGSRLRLEEFIRQFWDEYPDKDILVDELTDRGAEVVEALELIETERRRRAAIG
jgi:hypothetical protein